MWWVPWFLTGGHRTARMGTALKFLNHYHTDKNEFHKWIEPINETWVKYWQWCFGTAKGSSQTNIFCKELIRRVERSIPQINSDISIPFSASRTIPSTSDGACCWKKSCWFSIMHDHILPKLSPLSSQAANGILFHMQHILQTSLLPIFCRLKVWRNF